MKTNENHLEIKKLSNCSIFKLSENRKIFFFFVGGVSNFIYVIFFICFKERKLVALTGHYLKKKPYEYDDYKRIKKKNKLEI